MDEDKRCLVFVSLVAEIRGSENHRGVAMFLKPRAKLQSSHSNLS